MSFISVAILSTDDAELSIRGDSSTNLYETKSIASISRELDATEPKQARAEGEPILTLSESNGSIVAVSTEKDVSFFKIGVELSHIFSQSFDENVVGLTWLSNSSLLLVVLGNGRIIIVSIAAEIVVLDICPTNEKWSRCWLSSYVFKDSCHIAILSSNGDVCRFSLLHWKDLVAVTRKTVDDVIAQSFYSASLVHSRIQKRISECHFMPSGILLAIGTQQGHVLCADGSDFDFLFDLCDDSSGWRFVRPISEGRFIAAVSFAGDLVVFDALTYLELFRLPLVCDAEKVLDVVFVECVESVLRDSNIILIVRLADNSIELRIRSLSSPYEESAYSVEVAADTSLVALSAAVDRVTLFVEHADSSLPRSEQEVRLNEVIESHPEQRLERLLASGQLDEAELFAVKYKLDLQKVHASRILSLLNQINIADCEEKFKDFMGCLQKVEDDNMVGDFCLSAAESLIDPQLISSVIAYARTRNVTDDETLSRLHTLCYNLYTYRMVFGPAAEFDGDSSWGEYKSCEGPGWHSIWLNLIRVASIAESRIVWSRYTADITSVIHNSLEEKISEFFSSFESTLFEGSRLLHKWREVVEHLEVDILPFLANSEPMEVIPPFSALLVRLSQELETHFAEDFPSNALHATRAVERMLSRMSGEKITPNEEAALAFTCAQVSDVVEDLSRRARNLKAIAVLKDVYECPLSYHSFETLSTEEICHRILEQSVQNPAAVKSNIERLALPFMQEHHLSADETLLRYVQKASSMCSTNGVLYSSSEPFILHCLAVSEAISKQGIRAAAVALIAKTAHPPWPRKLKEAVHAILVDSNVDITVANAMRTALEECELALILMKYSLTFQHLPSVLSRKQRFLRFLDYLISKNSEMENFAERVEDALKAAHLFSKMRLECETEMRTHVYVIALKHLVLEGKVLKLCGVHEMLESLCEEERAAVVDAAIERISHIADSTLPSNPEMKRRRVSLLSSSLSLIVRYRFDDSECQLLYAELRRLLKLQDTYELTTTFGELRSERYRCAMLRDFSTRKERDLSELHALARTLGMSVDEESILLLQLAADNDPANVLYILKDCMVSHCSRAVSTSLLEAILAALDRTLLYLHSTISSSDHPKDEAINNCCVIMEEMTVLVDELVCVAVAGTHLEPRPDLAIRLLRINEFCCLFMATCHQLDAARESQSDSDCSSSNNQLVRGFSRRLSTYEPREDGPIFGPQDVLEKLCCVAKSFVLSPSSGQEDAESQMESELAWSDLLSVYSLYGQSVLEMRGRVLHCLLTSTVPDGSWRSAVRVFSERLLIAHPCDLWAVVSVLGAMQPIHLLKMVTELGKWAGSRRNPQTTLNTVHLAQFCSLLLGAKEHFAALEKNFLTSLCQKRISKLGVTSHSNMAKCIAELAALPVLPSTLHEFLEMESVRQKGKVAPEWVSGHLLHYVLMLVNKASSLNSSSTSSPLLLKLLTYADMAIQLIPSHSDLFHDLRDAFDRICPYAHEVIHFVLRRLHGLAKDDASCAWVEGSLHLCSMIIGKSRREKPVWQECAWFAERQAVIQDQSVESKNRFDAEERNKLDAEMMPVMSSSRLPFHLFTESAEEVLSKSLRPVLLSELCVSSVSVWSEVISRVPWLAPSPTLHRVGLLTKAIIATSLDAVAKFEKLHEKDVVEMETELVASKHHILLLDSFSSDIWNVPPGEIRIQLLRIGHRMALRWMQDESIDQETREVISQKTERITSGLSLMQTRHLLEQHSLHNLDTKTLMDDPNKLISLLHTKYVNWDDAVDCEKKMNLMNQLAAVNGVRLEQVHENLLHDWLPDGQFVESSAGVDLNDTMGASGFTESSPSALTCTDNEEVFELPIFHSSITRIVRLVRMRTDNTGTIRMLLNTASKDASLVTGGHKTRLRALCVLLRFSEERLREVIGMGYESLCMAIERVLYTRLMDISVGADRVDAFMKATDKLSFVKSLLSGTQRGRPHMAHLAASICIDYELTDAKVVEYVLVKMHGERNNLMLSLLLRHSRDEPSLRSVKNLNVYWGRTLDWALGLIDESEAEGEAGSRLRECLLFALSCPVEGGRAFDSPRSAFLARSAQVSAHLIHLSTSYTKIIPRPSLDRRNKELDLNCCWAQSSSSP